MDVLDAQAVGDAFPGDQAAGDVALLGPIFDSAGGYYNIGTFPVYVQYAYGRYGEYQWTPPVPIPVGPAILTPGTVAVRFRNYNPGQAAVVSGALSERNEPVVQITSGGLATPNQGRNVIPVYQIASWPPLSPADGDVASLVPDPANFPGLRWLFQYDSTSPSASKWEFLGGPPMLASLSDATIENLPNSAAYVAFPTNVTLTVPRTGDYDVAFGVTVAPPPGAGNDLFAQPSFGAGDSDAIFTTMQAAVASEFGSFERTIGPKTIAGDTVAVLNYRTNAGIGNSRRSKYLSILPLRIQ